MSEERTEISKEQEKDFSQKWESLSDDGLKLSIALTTVATSGSRDFLEYMATTGKIKFNLDKGIEELNKARLIEEVTFVQELEERVKTGTADWDDKQSLKRYRKNPKSLAIWAEPRWRLVEGYKEFVISTLKSLKAEKD